MKFYSKIMKNRVYKNASWIIVCKLVQAILSLVVSMIAARYLGPSNFGLINYAISITAFVLPIAELGLSNILVQELVNNPEDEGEVLGTSIIMSVFSALLCMVGVNVFVLLVNGSETDTIIVCACYCTCLLFQALDLIRYWYQYKLLSKYTSLIMLASSTLVSIYKIVLLFTGKNVYWFSIAYTIDFAITAAVSMWIYKHRLSGQKFSFNAVRAKTMFSRSKYYIISSLMVTIFAQTDKVMLKLMLSNESVGFYSASVTCAALSGFVFQAIIDSARPLIFENQKKSQVLFENSLVKLYSVIIYSCLLTSLAVTIFSRIIVLVLYGNEYIASVSILRISVWYMTFSFLGVVRNIWILAENKQKYLWKINILGAVANVILNYLFIPTLGSNGAALASVITQMFTNIFVGYIIKPIKYNNHLMGRALNPKTLFRKGK